MPEYWMAETFSQESKTVVERYLHEVLNGNRAKSAEELISDERLIRAVENMRAAFPDLHVEARVLIAGDELVCAYLEGSGTHLGAWFGNEPTGKTWTTGCVAMYAVRDQRIADFWICWDWLDMCIQLGLVEDPLP